MGDIDVTKRNKTGAVKYKLRNATVLVSQEGFHFTNCLDPTEEFSLEVDPSALTDQQAEYIETQLQSNAHRFDLHVALVRKYLDPNNKQVLDVGCGGGLFLSLLKEYGSIGTGIELSDARCQFARTRYGLNVVKQLVESPYWQDQYAGTFDLVTIWDVMDHVNFPQATLNSAVKLLKPGGFLMLETVCRDSFYHRTGEMTYSLSGGRYPTFLNAMYASEPFGRKQIFSSTELRRLLTEANLEVRELKRFHQLAFPYEFYLRKLVRSEMLVKAALPLLPAFFGVFRIRNKMIAVGQKR